MGSSDEVFLITEVARHLKQRKCPEDRSGLSDAELWRTHLDFGAWRSDKPRPVCERPVFDPSSIATLRERYLDLAGTKRLVIKNPMNLARVDIVKLMFPDARFIFSLRAPWPTIRSATIKGNGSYVVPTEFVNNLPNDHILRAAATWAEAIDVLRRERDANWLVVRYEEVVANSHSLTSKIYSFAGIGDDPIAIGATRLPEPRVRDFSLIKYQMRRHQYRAEIFALLEDRARIFGYPIDLSKFPGNLLRYAAEMCIRRWRRAGNPKISPSQPQ